MLRPKQLVTAALAVGLGITIAFSAQAFPGLDRSVGIVSAVPLMDVQFQNPPGRRPPPPPGMQPPPPPGGGFYYRGYRGVRHPRPGWRRYRGWWFPPQAFIVAPRPIRPAPPPRYAPPPRHGMSPAHYDWCLARYRSYRPRDNSYQPYNGPRRACVSPYWP